MKKENVLFGITGLLAGLIIGFMFANSVNQTAATSVPAAMSAMQANSNLPPGHPDIGSAQAKTITPEMQAAIDRAKQQPGDLDAQLKAAEAYYQIEKFDEAIAYLTAANEINPQDREILVHLGNANFDAERFTEAEKWYMAALAKKSDDVNVRTDLGLTFVFREPANYDRAIEEFNRSLAEDPGHIQTLQNLTVAYTKKGDATKASATLAKLEEHDAKNAAISKLREDIKKIQSK
jgi:tetratricopeptide (TPR) repeat protein